MNFVDWHKQARYVLHIMRWKLIALISKDDWDLGAIMARFDWTRYALSGIQTLLQVIFPITLHSLKLGCRDTYLGETWTPAEARRMKLRIRMVVAPFTIIRLVSSFYALLTEV